MSAIRTARADEMDDLVALMHEAANDQSLFPVSDIKARAMLNLAFNKEGGICVVIGPRGHVEGACYLEITQPRYSDVWLVSEIFNYVRPAFRRSTHARDFIAEAKIWALKMNVPLFMGVLSNERTEAKVRLYRRQLGNPVGAFFVFNTNWDRPASVWAGPYGVNKVAGAA